MPHMGKRPRGLIRAWAVAAVVAAFAASPPAATAVPSNFWGVSPQTIPTTEHFQRLKAGGVDSVRIPITWNNIQPVAGLAPNWSGVDGFVGGAALAGVDVLPFVYDTPSWVVPRVAVPGSRGTVSAPRTLPVKRGAQRAAWKAFLQQVVLRYGPQGSFWAENPAIPRRPIRTWQIWNEQNFKYFVVRPNPVDYGKLLNVSYAALRSVDTGAKIILGGMFAHPNEARFKVRPPQAYFATDFLERLYEAFPGIKAKFIGAALHPYTGKYQNLTPEIEEFRRVMKEHGDAGKGLWITEVTWSSQPPDPLHNSFAKGPRGQVKQLSGAFRLFERWQAKWRLKRIYWFSVEDAPPGACNFCAGSGLFGPGFVPKQSWFAFVRFAGGRP